MLIFCLKVDKLTFIHPKNKHKYTLTNIQAQKNSSCQDGKKLEPVRILKDLRAIFPK